MTTETREAGVMSQGIQWTDPNSLPSPLLWQNLLSKQQQNGFPLGIIFYTTHSKQNWGIHSFVWGKHRKEYLQSMIHEIVFSFSDWRMTSPGHSKHMCGYYWNYSCKIFSCSLNTGEISAGFLQMTCYHLPCFDIILWLIGSCSLKKIIYLTAVGLSCSIRGLVSWPGIALH